MISTCAHCKKNVECGWILRPERKGVAALINNKDEGYFICETCKIELTK